MKIFKKSTTTRKTKHKPWIQLSKRQKFVGISFFLSAGIIVTQNIEIIVFRYGWIMLLSILSAALTAWSLREDLRKSTWFLALILPTLFTASVNLFYFLLPESIIVRISLVSLFAIGMYALLLTENIFTVAALRTIQLLRAGQALGFVLSLLVAFFLFDTIYSFRLEPWFNAILVLLTTFPLALQGVWSSTLEESVQKETWFYAGALAWFLGQLSFFISFWPVSIVITSLFLVTMLYIVLGIEQQAVVGRLFKKTVREYVQVGIAVLLILLFISKWGG